MIRVLFISLTLLTVQAGVAAEDVSFATSIQPLLKKHCIRCHGRAKQNGGLRLDTLTDDFDSQSNAAVWVDVMDNLNLGQMPPQGSSRLSNGDHQQFVQWIAAQLRAAEKRAAGSNGGVLLRRLNRVEYANTLRDLLYIELLPDTDAARRLPSDATFDGFDKVGARLMLDPSRLDAFYRAGRDISTKLMVDDGPPEFPTRRTRFEFEDTRKVRDFAYVLKSGSVRERQRDLAIKLGWTRVRRGLLYPNHFSPFPETGRYTIRVRASANVNRQADGVKMYVKWHHAGEPIQLMDVEVAEAKTYEVAVVMDGRGDVRPVPFFSIGKDTKYKDPRELYLDWIEVEGPLREAWPPKSHTSLLFRKGARPSAQYARQIFARFLPRAYRRPVDDDEVGRVVSLVTSEMKRGTSFREAIEIGISYVLASPDFLYLVEPAGSDGPRNLNDFELASRLSYFLWSSMPDDTLFDLARSGTLSSPGVLEREVARMFRDPKARALIDGFATQWLRTDRFHDFVPDSRIYRGVHVKFGSYFQDDMVAESLAFFREVLVNELSILNFLDSDFVMVNELMARYYGLPAVKGNEFRRVMLLPGSPRGGLLGQAGVHVLGSDGLRTKPVTRGVYIREVLFNDPPDSPPPNVGEIEPNIKGERLTVRQRLEQHQQIESCANCHRGIDPYGLALENFDVTGAWRTRQNGEDFIGRGPPIDASGTLPDGRTFKNFEEFKTLLMTQKDRFRRAFAEKLFVYALGRPLSPLDRGTIEEVVTKASRNGDSITAVVQALVQTKAFQTK